jgi:hypothetical protein
MAFSSAISFSAFVDSAGGWRGEFGLVEDSEREKEALAAASFETFDFFEGLSLEVSILFELTGSTIEAGSEVGVRIKGWQL